MLYAVPNLWGAHTEKAFLIFLIEAQMLYYFSSYLAAQILSILGIYAHVFVAFNRIFVKLLMRNDLRVLISRTPV